MSEDVQSLLSEAHRRTARCSGGMVTALVRRRGLRSRDVRHWAAELRAVAEILDRVLGDHD